MVKRGGLTEMGKLLVLTAAERGVDSSDLLNGSTELPLPGQPLLPRRFGTTGLLVMSGCSCCFIGCHWLCGIMVCGHKVHGMLVLSCASSLPIVA